MNATPPPSASTLAGRTIAIAEARELDIFAALLERRGARVLRYPLVQIVDAPDPAPVLQFAEQVAAGSLDDLILLTGEGLRRILRCIEQHWPSARQPFVDGLAGLRKITRGPKPARALRELGLSTDLPAAAPTTQGVIAALREIDLRGRRIGVQLYGDDPNLPLMQFLNNAGAHPSCVMPYRYTDGTTSAAVSQLLQRMRAGAIDAIAFTSKAQIDRLFRAAPADDVRAALCATRVAVVGPVVRDALAARGVNVDAMPDDSWFMKPLTSALSEMLAAAGQP